MISRRDFIATVTASAGASTAGCLSAGSSDDAQTLLEKPEDQQVRSANLPYPAYGQPLPEVTLDAPLSDEPITTTQFQGTFVAMTFFYSNCNVVCPFLIAALRDVQTAAAKGGWSDEVVFLPITFDPDRDGEERLRQYADEMHVDLDAGNWYFLRPEDADAAKRVVTDTFGVNFWRTNAQDTPMYMFDHLSLVLLANHEGVVERAYRGNNPPTQEIIADVRTMRDRRR